MFLFAISLVLFMILFVLIFVPVWYFSAKKIDPKLLNRVPGPIKVDRSLFALVLVAFVVFRTSKRIKKARELFKSHGPMFRVWGGPIPFIHVGNAELGEIILSSSVHINKGFIYDFLRPWLGDGLLTSTGEKWRQRRKKLTPAFHFKMLDTYMDIFDKYARIFNEQLEKELDSEKFDIFPYLTECTLDVICETAMGVEMNIQKGLSKEYISCVHTTTKMIADRVLNPFLFSDFIHSLSFNGKKQKKSLKVLHDMSNKVIQQKMDERKRKTEAGVVETSNDDDESFGYRKKSKAFLDLLLDIWEEDPRQLTLRDIREEVDTFMFEGHDTTSAALAWTVFLVGRDPEVQNNIVEELNSVFGSSDRSPTIQDLNELKYLECVLKESMRLYPSVPIISRQLTEEITMGGYRISPGTIIFLHIHNIHRMEEYWPNPNKFDPTRFYPENIRNRHPFAYVPFSGGPRNCIGQKFAMLEEKSLLSTFFRKYEVYSVDREEDLTVVPDTILRSDTGIWIKIKKRKYD